MSDNLHSVSACESVSSKVTTTLCNILANQFFGPRSPRLRGKPPRESGRHLYAIAQNPLRRRLMISTQARAAAPIYW